MKFKTWAVFPILEEKTEIKKKEYIVLLRLNSGKKVSFVLIKNVFQAHAKYLFLKNHSDIKPLRMPKIFPKSEII